MLDLPRITTQFIGVKREAALALDGYARFSHSAMQLVAELQEHYDRVLGSV
jgi:hypothetical protein